MKPTTPRSVVRPFARAAVLLTAVVVVALTAVPAQADVPENFSDPAPVSILEVLVVIVGIPLALVLVISLLALAPSMVKEKREQDAAEERAITGGDAAPELESAGPPSLEK